MHRSPQHSLCASQEKKIYFAGILTVEKVERDKIWRNVETSHFHDIFSLFLPETEYKSNMACKRKLFPLFSPLPSVSNSSWFQTVPSTTWGPCFLIQIDDVRDPSNDWLVLKLMQIRRCSTTNAQVF